MKSTQGNFARETRFAKSLYGDLPKTAVRALKELILQHKVSVVNGDVRYLSGGWYVTHSGLLRIASRRRCFGIRVQPVGEFCDKTANRWVFKASVFKSRTCMGFIGYGDADPTNVSFLMHGAEMRIAESRAVDRALRKAFGVGICSVEEIGARDEPNQPFSESKKLPPQPANGKGERRTIRDRLCQIIRQHQLDPNLVKAYAADFCGVKAVRDATREQVENFVTHLADWASKDRNALLCQLNSYLPPKEGAA